MTHTDTAPAPADDFACVGFPGACGALGDQPCEPGCPSLATDEASPADLDR